MADKKPSPDEEEQAKEEKPEEELELSEEPEEQPEEPEESEEEPEEPEELEEEPKKPSRRENLRIRELVSKLQQQGQGPPQATPPGPPTPQGGLDYKEAFNVDEETLKQLEEDRRKYAETAYSQGRSEAQKISESNLFHTRLEIDAPQVASKYSFLDKESSDFHPALADAVNEMYLSTVGYDPRTRGVLNADIRYRDFVDGIFELADEVANNKVADTRKNVTKQAAQTGLRPDGSKSKRLNLNKLPTDMTDEELDAAIQGGLPKS